MGSMDDVQKACDQLERAVLDKMASIGVSAELTYNLPQSGSGNNPSVWAGQWKIWGHVTSSGATYTLSHWEASEDPGDNDQPGVLMWASTNTGEEVGEGPGNGWQWGPTSVYFVFVPIPDVLIQSGGSIIGGDVSNLTLQNFKDQ